MFADSTDTTTQSGVPRYRQAPGILTRRGLDGLFLLPQSAEHALLITGIGPVVWTLLERASTLSELSDDLAELVDKPASELVGDLRDLLEHLMIAGALCVD
jgi:hypothetical protein